MHLLAQPRRVGVEKPPLVKFLDRHLEQTWVLIVVIATLEGARLEKLQLHMEHLVKASHEVPLQAT
jgi:hypothetical protein